MWISTLDCWRMIEGKAGGYSFRYKFAETAAKCFSFCSLEKTRNWLGINWLIWFEGLLFEGFVVVFSPSRVSYDVWSSQDCENFTLVFWVKISWSLLMIFLIVFGTTYALEQLFKRDYGLGYQYYSGWWQNIGCYREILCTALGFTECGMHLKIQNAPIKLISYSHTSHALRQKIPTQIAILIITRIINLVVQRSYIRPNNPNWFKLSSKIIFQPFRKTYSLEIVNL
jgi:hypothetical protein